MSRSKTMRTLFTTGPNYVEAENNANLTVRMTDDADCTTLPTDLVRTVCETCVGADCKVPVMVFGDGDAAAGCREGPVPHLALGAASDYATPWHNCAGWPQVPGRFYPDHVRVWVR
jgi:hypothetical protein